MRAAVVRTAVTSGVAAVVIAMTSASSRAEDRTYDGSGNNTTTITWGSTGVDLLRLAPVGYGDGISTPAGSTRASARAISNAVSAHPAEDMPNSRGMTDMVYAWGQFIDHDMDLTPSGVTETFNVSVPIGDASFDPSWTGSKVIPFTRSVYDLSTGTSAANPRQQYNTISTYIDGSAVYGSDSVRAAALRSGTGGKLATSAGNLMPFNTGLLANANDAHIVADNQLFLGGDVRANENIELTAVQTLFVREHNRLADKIAAANPSYSDEQIYQAARKIVGAEIQSITYKEFIPKLMGTSALTSYTGYKSNVNAGIATEFSTAAYRFGHSMLANDVEFLNNDGSTMAPEVPLANAFFNPTLVSAHGVDPILKYLVSSESEEVDTKVVEGVRNFLFGPPGSGGMDLAALNIQRGRDHGLATYNQTRAAFGLTPAASFADITADPTLQAELESVYSSVNDVDLWVGGLAEDHIDGSSLGATFEAILADQFERLRDGDRFYFEGDASLPAMLATLGMSESDLTLDNIIMWNTDLTDLSGSAFSVPEPASMAVMFGFGAMAMSRRRRRASTAR